MSLYLETRNCLKGGTSTESANNLVDFNTTTMLILTNYDGKASQEDFFRLSINEMLLIHRRVSARFDKKDLKNISDRNVSAKISTLTEVIDIENGKCLSFHQDRKGDLVMSEKPLNKHVAKKHTALFTDLAKRMTGGEEPRLIPAKKFTL